MELDMTGLMHSMKAQKLQAAGPGRAAAAPAPRRTPRGPAPHTNTAAAVAGQGLALATTGAAATATPKDHRGRHAHQPQGPHDRGQRKCVCPPPCSDRLQAPFPQVWNELRLNQQLCDGAIHCADGKVLKVHRAILSAVSPYFKTLFTNSLSEHEASEVRLEEAGADLVRSILDYAYTGQCCITARNVERLLPLADRLDVAGVVQQCCRFLLREMQPDNCLGIFRFAQQYFCSDLEASGRRFILRHFRRILHESAELYDLTASELCHLLADDELSARSEALVFEAIRRWVDRDVPARRQHLADLLACVRLGLTSSEFLEHTVMQYAPVREDQALLEALAPARAFLADAEARGGAVDPRNPLARPRVPHEILFAVGGWSASSPTNTVETYDCRANRWCLSFSTDTQPRAYHGLVELDGLIYMIGGFDGVEHHNTVRSFNPVTREWREQACMYQARCYVSVCTLGGEIYAVGGFDGRSRMKSAETYDPQKNQWHIIPPMNRARSDASAAALNGRVYIAGGFNGQDLLSCAEVFDPGTLQWTCITHMQNLRSGVSLLAHHGYLYALGGFSGHNGNGRLKSGERYDPLADIWQPIPDMLHPRSNFAAVILDDHIYVIGGFNGLIIPNTECFDFETNTWSEANMMNLNRSALSAVVLAGLPTAKEYSYLQILLQEHCAEDQ